jgi:hypothetical protein
MDAHEKRIAHKAHELWEQEGRPHGRDQDHWEQARFLVGIGENPTAGTLPNPSVPTVQNPGGTAPSTPPVEPIREAVESAGAFAPGATRERRKALPQAARRQGGLKQPAQTLLPVCTVQLGGEDGAGCGGAGGGFITGVGNIRAGGAGAFMPGSMAGGSITVRGAWADGLSCWFSPDLVGADVAGPGDCGTLAAWPSAAPTTSMVASTSHANHGNLSRPLLRRAARATARGRRRLICGLHQR